MGADTDDKGGKVQKMTEIMERIKRRLTITSDDKDALLADLLEDAESYIKAYTGRARMPAMLAPVAVELAAGAYNRLGIEGETMHSEGGISMNVTGLPKHLRDVLNNYRMGKVGDA